MVSLIRVCYITLVVHGLATFRLTKIGSETRAIPSTSLTLYCITFTIILIAVMAYSEYENFVEAAKYRYNLNTISAIVLGLDIASTSIRTFGVYIIQMYKRNDLIKLLNFSFHLRHNMLQRNLLVLKFRSQRFVLMSKIVAIAAQVTAFIYVTFGNVIRDGSSDIYFWIKCLSYYKDLFILLFANLFFAGMLVAWQLLFSLNCQLLKHMQHVNDVSDSKKLHLKMQQFCNISDHIDMLTGVYSSVYSLVRTVNIFFNFQLVLLLTDCFLVSLAHVIFRLGINLLIVLLSIFKFYSSAFTFLMT